MEIIAILIITFNSMAIGAKLENSFLDNETYENKYIQYISSAYNSVRKQVK